MMGEIVLRGPYSRPVVSRMLHNITEGALATHEAHKAVHVERYPTEHI